MGEKPRRTAGDAIILRNDTLREVLIMSAVIICEPIIYCPICGFKRDPNNHNDIHNIILGINSFIKRNVKNTSDNRCIAFECANCKTKLIYDTKEETIKIIK